MHLLFHKVKKKSNQFVNTVLTRIATTIFNLKTKYYVKKNLHKKEATVVLFSSNNSHLYNRLYLITSYLLSKNYNVLPVNLHFKYPTSPMKVGGVKLSNFLNKKITYTQPTKASIDWIFEPKKKYIGLKGLNFFHVILNRIQAEEKSYEINLNNSKIYERLLDLSNQTKDLFLLFKIIVQEIPYNKIVFVGRESGYVPDGILKHIIYSNKINRVSYADFGYGYASYFGGKTVQPKFMATNCTYEGKDNRLELRKKDLLSKVSLKDEKEVMKKILSRAAKSEATFLKQLKDLKVEGLEVFVLFSHMFYDKPPIDASQAFSSMLDWIDVNIEFFSKSPDKILILKPHINEEFIGEEHRNPHQLLKHYVKDKIKDLKNVFLLSPRDYTLKDLIPFMDTGLVWRSSVGLELIASKKSIIVAGPAPYMQALDIKIPNSKNEYLEQVLEGGKKYEPDLAVKYIVSLDKSHVSFNITNGLSLIKQSLFPDTSFANWLSRILPDAYEHGPRSSTADAETFRVTIQPKK